MAHQETYGTQEYYAAQLQSENPSFRLAAARDLADKAAVNFKRCLLADYNQTLGVEANDTNDDEAMIADVEAQCEQLRADLIKSLEFPSQSQALQAEGLNQQKISPLSALFSLATLESTDMFLDIANPENPLSVTDQMHNLKDGMWDKFGFDINDPAQRQQAIAAIFTAHQQPGTLFRSTV